MEGRKEGRKEGGKEGRKEGSWDIFLINAMHFIFHSSSPVLFITCVYLLYLPQRLQLPEAGTVFFVICLYTT